MVFTNIQALLTKASSLVSLNKNNPFNLLKPDEFQIDAAVFKAFWNHPDLWAGHTVSNLKILDGESREVLFDTNAKRIIHDSAYKNLDHVDQSQSLIIQNGIVTRDHDGEPCTIEEFFEDHKALIVSMIEAEHLAAAAETCVETESDLEESSGPML